jgi:hypothetical protein
MKEDQLQLVLFDSELIRFYAHCEAWECRQHGMLRETRQPGDDELIERAADLLRTPGELLNQMRKVTYLWPISTAVNLSNQTQNRQAWLGWSSCFIWCHAPSVLTRSGWGLLTMAERQAANACADIVIDDFEERYIYGDFWSDKKVARRRRVDCGEIADCLDIRHFRENLSVIQRRKRFDCHAPFGDGRGGVS